MLRLSLACFAVLVVACSSRSGHRPPGLDGDGAVLDSSLRDSGPAIDAPRPDSGPQLDDVLIYAHSRNILFTFSPYSNQVMQIGPLMWNSTELSMLDLAVSADGVLYGSTRESLFRVDPMTAAATYVGDFDLGGALELNAMTFLAPREHPRGEILIGATNDGNYYEIDPANAHLTHLGTYPDEWLSSGDIVSVEGVGTFATVKMNNFPSDVLVQFLFAANGTSMVLVKGNIRSDNTDYRQIFGLGYWGRSVYGFTNMGELIEINRDNGSATPVTAATGTDQFWGAGVTTQAPVIF